MTDFQITEVAPDRYRLKGELDMASAPALGEALQPLAEAQQTLVLDLEDLTFIDSCGLRAIVQLSARLNGAGPLVLDRVPTGVQRLLDIVGLETLPGIEVRDDG